MTLLKAIIVNFLLIGLCFLITTFHSSAPVIISYDSIQNDGIRNDTITFAGNVVDANYVFNAVFISNDSFRFKLNKIKSNGQISATVDNYTLTTSDLKNVYGQSSLEFTATNTIDQPMLNQLISMIIKAVDDESALNPESPIGVRVNIIEEVIDIFNDSERS